MPCGCPGRSTIGSSVRMASGSACCQRLRVPMTMPSGSGATTYGCPTRNLRTASVTLPNRWVGHVSGLSTDRPRTAARHRPCRWCGPLCARSAGPWVPPERSRATGLQHVRWGAPPAGPKPQWSRPATTTRRVVDRRQRADVTRSVGDGVGRLRPPAAPSVVSVEHVGVEMPALEVATASRSRRLYAKLDLERVVGRTVER